MKRIVVAATFFALSLPVLSFGAIANESVFTTDFVGDSAQSAKINPFDARIVNGRLSIKFLSNSTSAVVGLHDILGNKVFESNSLENVDFSMAGLKSGVYFLVWKDNRNSFTRRIVYRQEN